MEQIEEVGDAIVYRRRRDEQYARTDDQSGEGPIAVGGGIPEAMGFVDDEQAGPCRTVEGGGGRSAERLVCHDRSLGIVCREQRSPLRGQHGGYDEREGLSQRQRHRERDVRLPQAHGIREQGAPVTPHDGDQALGGGDLMWREPLRPRGLRRRQRRQVEQRPRACRRDEPGRRFRAGAEQAGERLGERRELLRKNPRRPLPGGREVPAHGGPRRRGEGGPRRSRRRRRRSNRPQRACARRATRRAGWGARAPPAR